jgi:hypothetical protein
MNTTIGHNSFVKDSSFAGKARIKFSSPSKIGVTEVGIFKIGFTDNSASKYGSSKIVLSKTALTEGSITKVNPFQTTSPETTFIHTNSTKDGETQVALVKPTQLEIGSGKVGFSKDLSSFDSVSPIDPSKISSSEIFFSSSKSFSSFFFIHNTTPESVYTINSTALNLWNTLIQPSNPFDINLEITNLPTGQLAEAQVTKFDSLSRPIGSTKRIAAAIAETYPTRSRSHHTYKNCCSD